MNFELARDISENPLSDFRGRYLGFSPSDESACGLGEMEVIINDQGVSIKVATGLEIADESLDKSEVSTAHELTAEEIAALIFQPDADIGETRVFDVNGLHWIFFDVAKYPETPKLLIRGSMGDMLAPTFLFSPDQVEQGMHERMVGEIESTIDVLPRL